MMTNTEAKACREIDEILKVFPKALVDKVPQEIIHFFHENRDPEYEYACTIESFQPEELSEDAVAILTLLYRDYWASDEEKNKILKVQDFYEKGKQASSRESWQIGTIFEKSQEPMHEDTHPSLPEEQKGPFSRWLHKIKMWFQKGKK